MNETEKRRKLTRGYSSARVPFTTSHTRAEVEFYHFIARALCRQVLEDGDSELLIYRAREVESPQPGPSIAR